jgi:hypothetical protein
MAIKKTYFLGAGASKALHPQLPLASELTLNFLLDRSGKPIGFDPAIERVEAYIKEQGWSSEKRDIQFERVYLDFPPDLDPHCPRENLQICLFRKLKIEGLPGAIPGSWLEQNIYSGNTVITTNYDTTIEWNTENLSIAPIGYGDSGLIDYSIPHDLCLPLPSAGPRLDGRKERLLLLKLYGSLGWSRCQHCGKYWLERIYEAEGDDAITGRGKCGGCGHTKRSAVFVPLAGSKIADDPGLHAIWRRAEQVLADSEHIVFAGFSLDPNDVGVRCLLSRALSAGCTWRVTVVQPAHNAEILARYREIYGNRVEPFDLGWAKYLGDESESAFQAIR